MENKLNTSILDLHKDTKGSIQARIIKNFVRDINITWVIFIEYTF